MTTVFREVKGIIMVEYLNNGKTTNGTYFEDVVHRLRVKIGTMRHALHAAGGYLSLGFHSCSHHSSCLDFQTRVRVRYV